MANPADIAISDNGKSRIVINCLAALTRWRSSHWCGGNPVEIRKAREKWLTESSNSAAICVSDNFAAEIRLEPLAGAPDLPRRKAAAARLGGTRQSAIGLRDMRGESEHDVVDEKLAGLGRPAQRFPQQSADMPDDRIIMADAEFAGEIADTRRGKLFGNAVERRPGNIEVHRVERLVDHIARIVLEIVEIGCARPDVRLPEALAALPELALRIVMKLQADHEGILARKRAGETRHRIAVARFGDREVDAAQ